jgi:hypothetical protein
MRTEVMSVSEFLNGRKEEPFSAKVERHFRKYGTVYKIAGVTVILIKQDLTHQLSPVAESIPKLESCISN